MLQEQLHHHCGVPRPSRFVPIWQELGTELCLLPSASHSRHTYGVGRSDDSAAGLQRGDDASFGDGDALLFHGLVDAGPVLVIHLHNTQSITGGLATNKALHY